MAARIGILPTAVLALGLALPATAAEGITKRDRFELWARCQPMELVVEDLSNSTKKIGLRKAEIERAVRSRLRGARIYTDKLGDHFLYVRVSIVGSAYSARVAFSRVVEALLVGTLTPKGRGRILGFAATWETSSLGIHRDRPDYILSTVARHTDEFIDEYLRVNADACRKSRG